MVKNNVFFKFGNGMIPLPTTQVKKKKNSPFVAELINLKQISLPNDWKRLYASNCKINLTSNNFCFFHFHEAKDIETIAVTKLLNLQEMQDC